MADWNGTDPIVAGMRLSYRRGDFFRRKTIVLFISDFYFVGVAEDGGDEFGFPRGSQEEFTVTETDREIAVRDMAQITGKNAPQFLKYYGMIYDAGYRKQ